MKSIRKSATRNRTAERTEKTVGITKCRAYQKAPSKDNDSNNSISSGTHTTATFWAARTEAKAANYCAGHKLMM